MNIINTKLKDMASRGDERTNINVGKAATITMYLTYGYLIIGMIAKIAYTKSIDSVTSEVVLLILITITFLLSLKANKEYSPSTPLSAYGKPLNAELSREGRKSRQIRYLVDAVRFSIVMTLLKYLLNFLTGNKYFYLKESFAKDTVVSLVVLLIVFYLFGFISSERKVKKYNKFITDLEKNDEE